MGLITRHLVLATTLIFASYVVVQCQRGEDIFPVSCFLNVMIILDRSDSVLGGFNRSRDFVVDVSQELNIGPHAHSVSMIVYSGAHYRREIFKWNFAKSNEEFAKAVRELRTIGGTTNTKKALEAALELMDSRNKSIPSLIMVVTDGRSDVDPKGAAENLQRIPQTWVFAAATGDPARVDRKELLDIAGHVNHVVMQSGRQLATDITRKLLREAQDKCRTTTTSTTTTTTSTTTTTTTTNPFTGCEQDLVLVMDFSTTTSPVYRDYMAMGERLVRQLFISPRHTRVALVVFSSVGKTHTKFDLNRFKDADEVVQEIRNLQYIGGLTAVGEGIKEATKQSDPKHGARPNLANKIMVVFTDGWNNKGSDPGQEAGAARAAGFRILTVGVTDTRPDGVPLNSLTLDSITANSNDIFSEKNFDQLINVVRERNVRCL